MGPQLAIDPAGFTSAGNTSISATNSPTSGAHPVGFIPLAAFVPNPTNIYSASTPARGPCGSLHGASAAAPLNGMAPGQTGASLNPRPGLDLNTLAIRISP
jgi:hypothetical protein